MKQVKEFVPRCKLCGDIYPLERMKLGYALCMPCGEEIAQEKSKTYTVVPMHKSNYVAIFDRSDLLGINNKGGLVK